MIFKNRIPAWLLIAAVAFTVNSCGIYSFSQGSIPPEVKTVSVQRFTNNAAMVAPILVPTITEALQDKFTRETRLEIVREDGDFDFEGQVVNYYTAPASISAGEFAQLNRLTIAVKVKFTNRIDPSQSFDTQFTAYADYAASQLLQSVEGALIPEIVEQLVDDIFNKSASNW